MTKDLFKSAVPIYTGGNIWLFYGELTDGNYFLTDDNGATLILDTSPADLDESLYDDWQAAHLVRELDGGERVAFCDQLADRLLRHNKADNSGGITDEEIRAYKKFWRLPF